MESKKEEVLRQLKLVRKAKGLSYQNIVDGTESIGTAVSMSTVKRVFAENSKASEFKYSTTLRPIVRFLEESPDRIPFGDWYYTDSGKYRYFRARTVQGGTFILLL